MRENFGYSVKSVSDRLHKELMPNEIYDIFVKNYVNINTPIEFINYKFVDYHDFQTSVVMHINDESKELVGTGNGRLDAISNALQTNLNLSYTNLIYKEHALEIGSKSQAVSYVGISALDGTLYWGCGIDVDIMTSSIKALFSAINKMIEKTKIKVGKDFFLTNSK